MRFRPLHIERLERRELLSADVFVYGGANLTSRALKGELELLDWTQETLLTKSAKLSRETLGGNASDSNGVLLDDNGGPVYPVIFVTGGRAARAGNAMGAAGREAIVEHVMAGGSYVGSCAGAFLLADYSRTTLHLLPMRMPVNRSGTQTVSFAHLDDGHPVKEFLYQHGVTDYIVPNLPQLGGPRLSPANRHPDGVEFLGGIVSASRSIRGSIGTYFVVAYQPTEDSGIVLGTSGHPEYNRRWEHTVLNAALLNYARLRSQVETPVYVGDGDSAEGESWQVFVEPTTVVAEPITLTPDQPLEANEDRQELFASLATEREEIVYRPLPVLAVDAIMELGLLA
jgi:hypothetical protein